MRDTAQEALREMRLLIFELRPPALEKSGLIAALQARLEAVEGRGGMLTELRLEGGEGAQEADRVPLAIQEELFQIAREALNNVLKHAHARHVRIRVQFQDSAAYLEVCDDGVGFDPVQIHERGGLGLLGMKERAQKIGADLEITSDLGQGTTVRVTVGNVMKSKEPWGTLGNSVQVPQNSSNHPKQHVPVPAPHEENLYHLDETSLARLTAMPGSLGEAIEELRASELVKATLGDHLFDRYVEGRVQEWDEYRIYVSGWELERYLPVY